jgi:Glycolipid 2-alpha-mannosyltransferase
VWLQTDINSMPTHCHPVYSNLRFRPDEYFIQMRSRIHSAYSAFYDFYLSLSSFPPKNPVDFIRLHKLMFLAQALFTHALIPIADKALFGIPIASNTLCPHASNKFQGIIPNDSWCSDILNDDYEQAVDYGKYLLEVVASHPQQKKIYIQTDYLNDPGNIQDWVIRKLLMANPTNKFPVYLKQEDERIFEDHVHIAMLSPYNGLFKKDSFCEVLEIVIRKIIKKEMNRVSYNNEGEDIKKCFIHEGWNSQESFDVFQGDMDNISSKILVTKKKSKDILDDYQYITQFGDLFIFAKNLRINGKAYKLGENFLFRDFHPLRYFELIANPCIEKKDFLSASSDGTLPDIWVSVNPEFLSIPSCSFDSSVPFTALTVLTDPTTKRGCLSACLAHKECKFWLLEQSSDVEGEACSLYRDISSSAKNQVNREIFRSKTYYSTECILTAAKNHLIRVNSHNLRKDSLPPVIPVLSPVLPLWSLGDRGRCFEGIQCECFPPFYGVFCENAVPEVAEADTVLHYLSANADIDDLLRSLHHLHAFWLSKLPSNKSYPIVIFHDGVSLSNQSRLLSQFKNSLHIWFAYIPDYLSNLPNHKPGWVDEVGWSIGYRGMCRFRSGPLFNHPAIKKYRYAMTLDTDHYLPDFMQEDPIILFKRGGYKYGYSHIMFDQPAVSEYLWDFTQIYMKQRGLSLVSGNDLFFTNTGRWNMNLYMNDVEIVDMKWIRAKQYTEYFEYLDEQYGFWLHRWGDHAIRTFAVSMFLKNETDIMHMEIPYAHQQFCKCSADQRLCVKGNKLGGIEETYICIDT